MTPVKGVTTIHGPTWQAMQWRHRRIVVTGLAPVMLPHDF